MTDHNEPQHRTYHQSDPGRTTIREPDEGDTGVFVVRMPIASTGDVRNQGDDPLTRENLEGMAEQVNAGGLGTFLDHGKNAAVSGSMYSATGKVGEWQNAELVDGDGGETLLEADARMMDPDTLAEATGPVRQALATIKAQVDRDIGLSSSIGWRDDDAYPGGVDLMETSIVGIPADPRTTSNSAATARSVVMGPDGDYRHLSTQQADIAETLVNAYRDDQGNGSVENFESWLWNVAYYDFDDSEFHAAQTALQEFYRETTPLQDPIDEQFVPFLSSQRGGDDSEDEGDSARDTVTDSDTDTSGDGPDNTNDDSMDDQEYRESMLEMQRQQTETLSTLAEALREDGEDDEDDSEDDEDDDSEDDDNDNENAADSDVDERTVVIDGEERSIEDAIADLRDQAEDVDADDASSKTTDRTADADADSEESETRDADDDTTDSTTGFGFAGVGADQ